MNAITVLGFLVGFLVGYFVLPGVVAWLMDLLTGK